MCQSPTAGVGWIVIATLLALAGTGCGSSSARTVAPEAGAIGGIRTTEAAVRRLVMAVKGPKTETNDPRTERGPTNWVFRPFYEYLVGIDPSSGKYVPQLATEWKVEPDGKSFRFKLRQGVKYHSNAGEWNADAFIETFKVQVRDDDVSNYGLLYPLIKNIEKVGPYEAMVHLGTSDGTFLLTASEQRGVFYMLSGRHFQQLGTPDWNTGPAAGTGPYQFKERAQGLYIRYERVPYQHWRVRADFPEFEFRFQSEASTRLASLLTGDVHMADLPEDLKAHAVSRGYKLSEGRLPGLRSFMKIYCCHMNDRNDMKSGWQHSESPLADVRVRRALSKAIDRTQLNRSLFGGLGKVMYNAHFHPTRPGWDPAWESRFPEEYGYDLEGAKKLLADAGYGPSKPLQTNLLFPSEAYGYSSGDEIQDAIGTMWRRAGIHVNYVTVEPAQRLQMTEAQQLWNHMVLGGTSADMWTGITTYGSTLGTSKGVGIEVPTADAVLGRIRRTLDPGEQDKIWRRAGQILYDQHREIPLFWVPVAATVDPQVVSDYDYPGAITGTWTHIYNIRAAR